MQMGLACFLYCVLNPNTDDDNAANNKKMAVYVAKPLQQRRRTDSAVFDKIEVYPPDTGGHRESTAGDNEVCKIPIDARGTVGRGYDSCAKDNESEKSEPLRYMRAVDRKASRCLYVEKRRRKLESEGCGPNPVTGGC